MNEIFAKISNRIKDAKLSKTALSLHKHFKPTRATELERNFHFVTELYFANYPNEVLAILNKIEEIKFNGNHNHWSFIQPLLFLKCRIIKDSDNQKVQSIVKIIEQTVEYSKNELVRSVNLDVKTRRLQGEHLYYSEIEKCVEENNIEAELNYRKLQFYGLLYIYFLGGSDKFPAERAKKEIEETEKRIKERCEL